MKRILLLLAAFLLAFTVGGAAYLLFLRAPARAPGPVTIPVNRPAVQAAPSAAPGDCLLPGPAPVPPNGATASAADMALGHDAAQAFVLQLEAYQKCRDDQADHAAAEVSQEKKSAWIQQGDDAVDQAHAVADAFGTQLQIFKARTKSGPGKQ